MSLRQLNRQTTDQDLSIEASGEQSALISFGAYSEVATGILSAVSIYSVMERLQVLESGWPTPELQLTRGSTRRTL